VLGENQTIPFAITSEVGSWTLSLDYNIRGEEKYKYAFF
jgi:hypothetical protein